MKTITDIRDWLLENAVDEDGDLQLTGLDFSDFDGEVYIDEMIVKRDLHQDRQTVGHSLYQSHQTAEGNLYQSFQKVGDDLFQYGQTVGYDLYQYGQTVGGERYEDIHPNNIAIEAKDSPNDLINSPNHYIGDNGLEVEQILREFLPRIKDAYVAHRIGSAIEYILRSPLKNGVQDYQKAIKNLEQALEHLGGSEE